MIWTVLAVLSAAIFGAVAVMDKRLIDKYVPTLSAFYLLVGISVLFYGLVFLALAGNPIDAPLRPSIVALVSGLSWGIALALLFWGYKLQEVSRASALVFTFPVFVALIAVAFLGESLGALQWLALLVVVAGGLLISLSGSPGGGPVRLTKAFPILIGASLLTALGHVTGKYALGELSVMSVTAFRYLAMAAVLAVLWRRSSLAQIRDAMRSKEVLILIIVSIGILVPVAEILMIIATKLGPVSLVATLTATRPVFIFLFGTILSMPSLRFLNESVSRNTLAVKAGSVVMIIGGIVWL